MPNAPKPYPFINRELSWLDFNSRVLAEAEKVENLPLDRLKFLAITASNLDEFFMVRVAYLHDRSKLDGKPDDTGMTPKEQLEKVIAKAADFQYKQQECLATLMEKLGECGISFAEMRELDDKQLSYAEEYFVDEVLPVITPLAIDPSRPFPFLMNKSLNIGIRLHNTEGEHVYAVVQVPSIIPRFISIPSKGGTTFMRLESLIAHFLPKLFDEYVIAAYGFFRITRCADFDADDDTDNLLEEMKRTIKKRKRGKPIRLELSGDFDIHLRSFLEKMLRISKKYVIELSGSIDLASLSKIASLSGYDSLRPKPVNPVRAADFALCDDIFEAIKERDRLVHHPYQTFGHVVDFISAAASDPDVLAIKQTLYRVSGKSRIISALESAAEAGKQVTVLVELKARFDEENNIQWAYRLERAGCHVIYGLAGLKTHCKVTLVVRRESGGIKRYLHLSTGNYNDVTAKIYTDIGLFTCRPVFGADASALFNHLTGFSNPPQYNKLIVAPDDMKLWFLQRIQNEIDNAQNGLPCGISIKINSLLDGVVIRKLYEASEAGVPVKLLVRGICALLPGTERFSANIKVRSIVGQLLEHSRIFVFENNGDPLVYMGSADLMPRNLDKRVEVIFPVEDQRLREKLTDILDIMWQDNTNAWEMSSDGIYRQVERIVKDINSQEILAKQAAEELKEAGEGYNI